jgi:hypothetical protein
MLLPTLLETKQRNLHKSYLNLPSLTGELSTGEKRQQKRVERNVEGFNKSPIRVSKVIDKTTRAQKEGKV